MEMKLSSPVFLPGQPIPNKYTCEGENVSPPLIWHGVPTGAKSLALIMDDPDAPVGLFTHWILFNIPTDTEGLLEHFTETHVGGQYVQGRNSFGNTGYGGPCPPAGDPHRYFFRLYALDDSLPLGMGINREQLLDAIRPHLLDESEYMGTYRINDPMSARTARR
jgi:Raf kinase inhibitor-like YbhB/YbcL family protein